MIGFQPFETFQLLGETDNVERANTLLLASCDAFVWLKKPDKEEIEQFETLATRLFQTASPDIRERAANILIGADNLTPKIESLIIDNIGQNLEKFLLSAPQLSPEILGKLIDRKNIEINALIAKRADLPKPIITKLFQTNSRKTYRSLAANENIIAKGPYLNAFARSAQMDFEVARLLAGRKDFDKALLAPVFFNLEEADRIKIIEAFSERRAPEAPIKKTIEQISVAREELTLALMKLFSQNKRPKVTQLLTQISGLDEIKCGQIAHDESGAALFVILRAFGCTAYDGLKVIIHATSFEQDRSKLLAGFAALFQKVSVDSMAYMMSVWRNEVNLLDLTKPEFIRFADNRGDINNMEVTGRKEGPIYQAIRTLEQINTKRAS